ncbi:hypothetical protein SPF06_04450 [Sinomonas sp. JGH33]|uniref:Tat pathway signal protein n=1 Tax=Sinomonas terricola TaxID=3110330 RepID=A0ABU5T2T0_9MICC|nr:hypothetical protein [Sinomonas sp. JGH33]MEA5453967.1 hypothetical protein [Sinomonas sp. JGH33]
MEHPAPTEPSDRVAPPPGLAAFDRDAPLDEGYNQDEHYGHNQDFLLLRDPRESDERQAEPAHRERRRRIAGIGLGTAGAAGIPDGEGRTHTGFGDSDRD